MKSNGAGLIAAWARRWTRSCARLAGPSCPSTSQSDIVGEKLVGSFDGPSADWRW